MRPVYQAHPEGCLQAVVASILELPLGEVPDFDECGEEEWPDRYMEFLRGFGLYPVVFCVEDCADWQPKGYHLIIGKSPRNPGKHHATVGYNGEIVHDPFGDNEGMEITEYEVWVALLETPAS